MKSYLKRLVLQALVGWRWPRSRTLEDGYAILLPTPMDMPFLLRFALEGLQHVDTQNCKQILVIPDAWGTDGGVALRRVVAEFDDPRIAMAPPKLIDYALVRFLRGVNFRYNGSDTHWLAIVNGTAHVRCKYAFLHDADAFFAERDGLERQYRECRDRQMYSLGVTDRPDPFFTQVGYHHIAGTWELMYSVEWALRHGPYACKGGRAVMPHGTGEFDTMLRPQFLDYPSGKIGVMESPPEFVHFFAVILAYRSYRERLRMPTGRPIADQRLALVLLALLEDLIPDQSGLRSLPTVEELARGLTDPTAPVTYATVEAAHEYPIFRERIEALGRSPVFRGPRADQIRERLRPFDEYYQKRKAEEGLRDPSDMPKPHYVVNAVL
jgi:hypothetical protein